jgi:hypothetical protein
MRHRLKEIQQSVHARIEAAGERGLTSEELRALFPHYAETTSRTRISELVRIGIVVDSGMKRPSRSGRSMIVWTAVTVRAAQEELGI